MKGTQVSIAASVAVTAIGSTSLAGWGLGIDWLTSLGGPITMKANAAVGLTACGLALGLIGRPSGWRALAAVLATTAGALGALTLVEHVAGWNLGIDELLFRETAGAAATTSPGRMGPNASISLVLASAGLLSLRRETPVSAARTQSLACGIAILSLVALTGYWFGARELYAVARLTGIAWPTAVAFLTLAVGMLAARMDAGPIAELTGNRSGSLMARRLLPAAIALPLVLGFSCVLGERAGLYDTGFGTALFAIALVVTFALLIWRNARHVNALDAERQSAYEAAESANRLKDEFLATLSHELRTPLNAILGYARMLRTDVIPPEKRPQAVEIIERNAAAQAQLVDDLLDVSRVTMGRLQLRVEPVRLAAPLGEALESIRPAAEAKGLAIELTGGSGEETVVGDSGRLRQVLWNLLSNAVKFTPPGGRLFVRLDSEGETVRLTVRDSGVGIPAEFLPAVFDPFRQADARVTREHGGLGLGLAICRQLVELHGGSIGVTSDGVGQGAVFTIRLPRHTPAVDNREAFAAGAVDGNLAGLDVLVVDDQAESVELLRRLLTRAGANVRSSPTALDALTQVRIREPDLLVADIGLTDMDGYELLQRIRAQGGAVRALAVTWDATPEDRAKALAAGFQGQVAKPIAPAAFIAAAVAACGAPGPAAPADRQVSPSGELRGQRGSA